VLHESTVYSPDPETGKMHPETSAQNVPGLLNDIPGSDGENVFIRQMNVSSEGNKDRGHLYTSGGYLDSSWFNRTFWKIGHARTTGPMVLGDDVAYGIEPFTSRSRDAVFQPGREAYRLRCLSIKPPLQDKDARRSARRRRNRGARPLWEQAVGIRVTSLVRAGDTIFAAGPPDVVDPEDPHGAWEGRKGGLLAAFAAADGTPLAEIQLPAPPVWDGMAAIEGRLIISLMNGQVLCLRERS
jgi:hypothetical protein